MSVVDTIKKTITEQGAIGFDQFMHMALYTPNLGYYSSGLPKIGKQGDFVTAPELTPMFGNTLAFQVQEVFKALNGGSILEFGAGTGRLCIDVLSQCEVLDCLPEHYYILEVSGDLRQRQQQSISQTLPHLLERVVWLDSWPETPFSGVILANEVLDAMPIHRFQIDDEGIKESYITLNEAGDFIEIFKPCNNLELIKHIESLAITTRPYQSEVNLFINDWIKRCHESLARGLVLLIDYGFPSHEYYHPQRAQGTLMCHHQQRTHPNPLVNVGEQDITAHVDFTHLATAAVNAGLHVAGFSNQASFLLSLGLLSFLSEDASLNDKQAVKLLTLPHEMGELFKVMALTKAVDIDLQGFSILDKRATL